MLNRILSETLHELNSHRDDHRYESREIESRLNCLVFDIKCLIKVMEESEIKEVA